RPAWLHGVDQRIEMQTLGARDLSRSAGARLAAERALAMAGLASPRDVDVIELSSTTPAEELVLREAVGVEAGAVGNPSGGARWPTRASTTATSTPSSWARRRTSWKASCSPSSSSRARSART